MTDLNLWRLEYDAIALDFGTYATGHPLIQQVAYAANELVTDDMPHPLTDGTVPGIDRSPGMTLGFAGAHLQDAPRPTSRQWTPVLDGGSPFASAWRAGRQRGIPGWVATCSNIDRARLVYGRPRGYLPGLTDVRRGWLTYQAAFAAFDDRFYSTDLSTFTAQVLTGEVASGSDAVTYPGDPDLIFPADGGPRSSGTFDLTNDGTEDTWPVVKFTGGKNPRLHMRDVFGQTVWALNVSTKLGDSGEFIIDTRPWSRKVTRNGLPRPGQLAGSPLASCYLPPGTWHFTFSAANDGGESTVDVDWRDAYASL